MRIDLQFTVLLLLPIFFASLNAWLNPHTPPWNPMELAEGEIRLEQLVNWEGPRILVDARTAESYWSGHIPDAIHVSAGEFDSQILSLLDVWSPEKSVIVYCDSRLCDASKEVAQRLREDFGMDKVFVLKGGWESWLKANAR